MKGISVSPGIEIGKAYIYNDADYIPVSRYSLKDDEIEEEVDLFRKAVEDTINDIRGLHDEIAGELGESQANIIEAQMVFLEDKYLAEKTIERIKKEKMNAAFVFSKVIEETAEAFSNLGSYYLKGRVEDVRYIGRRVLEKMSGIETVPIDQITDGVIIVAHDLSPADTAMMKKENIIAFVTDMGSRTSHTAIMARSVGIPAVVGLKTIARSVENGDILIVDGNSGVVIINPDPDVTGEYEEKKDSYMEAEKSLEEYAGLAAQTLDGHRVRLMANIELPAELGAVVSHGADGIGLYRTEFLYLNRKNLPGEEEQYEAYSKVISRLAPDRVVIRTVDLGGDKFSSELDMPAEMNPFMGSRGIRFCLEQPGLFKTQLRAILRASTAGRACIMFPLISCLEEFRKADECLQEAKTELVAEGKAFDDKMETGIMIETPSSVMIADILAGEVDFFSIGTNDLIQYSMAVDRINERVAHLYRPGHPGILRMIKNVIDAAHSRNVRVDICGEMAGEEEFVLVLLGMGVDGLSMSPVGIPRAKKLIRSTTYDYAKEIAGRVLEMKTADEVEDAITSVSPQVEIE